MGIKSTIYHIFDQLVCVLEGVSNDEYAEPSVALSGSSVGQHVRHTLEIFSCLMEGMTHKRVNYDNRNRNALLENNTLEALVSIGKLRESIESVMENAELILAQCCGHNNDDTVEVKSNVYREMIYNIEHAVHHMALIKIGLMEVKPGLVLPKDFGVAKSTLRYRETQQVASS